MGAVWLARLVGKYGFEKLFAVKTIRAELADIPEFRAMFLDEARVVSRIHDDHVAEILDLGEAGRQLYMVMDWVDGEPLTRYVDRAKTNELPIGVAIRIILDACRGLHAAHDARAANGELLHVVHRDVSPHNILVTTKGTSRVIDFGIAKARDRFVRDSSIGQLKGKVRYMAPEQVKGLDVSPPTDVFGLGCVLYELLTGAPPFDAATDVTVVQRLLLEQPAAPIDPTRAPAPVAASVARALAIDVDKRFPTMDAFRADLEAAARSAGIDPSHGDVAAFTSAHIGAYTERRRRFVAEALQATTVETRPRVLDSAMPFRATEIDESSLTETALPHPSDSQTSDAAPTPTGVVIDPRPSSAVGPTLIARAAPSPPPASKRGVVVGAVGFAAVALAIGAFAALSRGTSKASSKENAIASPAVPVASAPASVPTASASEAPNAVPVPATIASSTVSSSTSPSTSTSATTRRRNPPKGPPLTTAQAPTSLPVTPPTNPPSNGFTRDRHE
jgi:serine/threonine-protein kinase